MYEHIYISTSTQTKNLTHTLTPALHALLPSRHLPAPAYARLARGLGLRIWLFRGMLITCFVFLGRGAGLLVRVGCVGTHVGVYGVWLVGLRV
jgi:hypothetical protein